MTQRSRAAPPALKRPFKLGFVLALMLPPMASAQDEAEITSQIFIELNTTQSTDSACTLTFQVINGHARKIDSAIYETVLFTADGTVERLTLFDFGTLPPARPRVRQFTITGLHCGDLGRVLINGAHECTADGLPKTACDADLKLDSRSEIDLIG